MWYQEKWINFLWRKKASMAGFNFSSRSYYYLRRDEVAAGPRSRPTTVSGREPGDVLGLFITPICVFIVSFTRGY